MSQSTLDMRGSLIGFVGILAVGLMPSPVFAASKGDVSSTHAVLVAANSALQSVVHARPVLEANLDKLNHKFAAECPDVGAGSPQSEAEQNLSYEVAGALWATAYHTDSKFVQEFITAASPLRWSNPAIGRRTHKFIRGLREMTSLQVPDLCADIRSWTASGYRTIPSSTLRFDRHVEAIEVEIPSPGIISAYVQPIDRALYAKVEHLLTRFEELEFSVGQRYWDTVLETLGLNQ
jgi:hypothetical protein